MSASPADQTIPVPEAAPLLQPLGDADAAVCVDGFCAVPVATDETQGADE